MYYLTQDKPFRTNRYTFLLTQMSKSWEKVMMVSKVDLSLEIKIKWPWCLRLSVKILKRLCQMKNGF